MSNAPHITAGVRGNVRTVIKRPGRAPLWLPPVHNIVTTEGLTAWAFNATSATGEIPTVFVAGTGTTAAALGDTGIETSMYSDEFGLSRFLVWPNMVVFSYWLRGLPRAAHTGSGITEAVLRTTNNGATASSNKCLSRVVLDIPLEIEDTETTVGFFWTFAWRWAVVADETGLDYGLHWLASRMYDVSGGQYDALSHYVVGSGTTAQDAAASALVTETTRDAGTFTPSGAVITSNAQIASGTVGAINEHGPGVGASAGSTLYQTRSTTADNTSNAVDWTSSLTLANV